MTIQAGAARHPHVADIPDPKRAEGVRNYREPEVPHPLQLAFLEPEGEAAWIEEMRALLSAGKAAEADARLSAALEGFDGALARLCKATRPEDVAIEGWEDLNPILAEWEGPPITAITLGLTNPPDLVFEVGQTHEPDLMLGLYSDESYTFSRATRAELVAECAKDYPAWIDAEEDVEFHCVPTGLAELNTALVQCKHRYFLRDGRDGVVGRAPGGYVEFVLGGWLLATRFLQAAERLVEEHGLPDGCRLIVGTVDIKADFITVLGPDGPAVGTAAPAPAGSEPMFASLTSVRPSPLREDPAVPRESAPTFRQRIKTAEAAPQPRRGFLARLFGRGRKG